MKVFLSQFQLKSAEIKMRTKRNWGVLSLLSGLLITLTGCLDEGSNTQSYEAYPSYVTFGSSGNMLMETLAWNVNASGLASSNLNTYGLSWYNVNFDEQPAGANGITVPYNANVYGWLPVGEGFVEPLEGEDFLLRTDTIIEAKVYASTLLRDHLFFTMTQKAPGDRVYRYHLTINNDSTEKYKIPMLYMQTEITSPGSGDIAQKFAYCFDVSNLLYSYAKDTTIKDSGNKNINCDLMRFELYYQSGKTAEGKPIFKASSDNPQTVYRIKTD